MATTIDQDRCSPVTTCLWPLHRFQPEYVAHSQTLFAELGLSDDLVHDPAFPGLFSGDISVATGP